MWRISHPDRLMISTTADSDAPIRLRHPRILCCPSSCRTLGLRGRLDPPGQRVQPRAQRASFARGGPAHSGRGAGSGSPARLRAQVRGPAQRATQGRRAARSSGHRLLCRCRPGGGLRGYARLDEQGFAASGQPAQFAKLAGSGALAITIEPKKGAQTYQGLVPLSPTGCPHRPRPISSRASSCRRCCVSPPGRPIVRAKAAAGAPVRSWSRRCPGAKPIGTRPATTGSASQLFLKTLEDYELLGHSDLGGIGALAPVPRR